MLKIQTALYADVATLQSGAPSLLAGGGDAVLLFVLGIPLTALLPFAATVATGGTPVLLADCYGILGYSAEQGRNLELMEAGRGQEYGGVGGDGGCGVVVVAFAGGGVIATAATLPSEGVTSHLVVAAHGSDITATLRQQAVATYYGGVAKATYRYVPAQNRFEPLPYFAVSMRAGADQAVGTTSFTADVSGALRALLGQQPANSRLEAVALFPCFMRGKNEYGINDVEPTAVAVQLPGVPVFGMFCHGELGPRRCLGFTATEAPQQTCTQHSMTTIVAVHAVQAA